MSEDKSKVGRPRKYATRSERQKAYHERKKEKMRELEKQVEKLEKHQLFSSEMNIDTLEGITFKKVPNFPWNKITPSEIALMGTQELESLIREFHERIKQDSSIEVSLENITLGIVSKNYLSSKEDTPERKIEELDKNIKMGIRDLEEKMQQQTLLYLMEAELANRQRLVGKKSKLDIFEEKIKKLEDEAKEKQLK